VAENSKNYDRFYQPRKIRTVASDTTQSFSAITIPGSSAVIDVSDAPMTTWTLQVIGEGGSPTLWEVLLEGSTDGINFSEILKHDTLTGDGVNVFSGTTLFLASYYRVNVTALTLGPATGITANVIGRQ